MIIDDVKINGLENPIGYNLENPSVSFKVKDTLGSKLARAKVKVFESEGGAPVFTAEAEGNTNHIPLKFTDEAGNAWLAPRTEYVYTIEAEDDIGNAAVSEPQSFETGKLGEEWSGLWVTQREGDDYAPIFTLGFDCEKPVKKARLYICGLGLYEAQINGQRVGDEILTPYISDYSKEVEYQSFDVTDLIQEANILNILVGEGWYKGRFGLGQEASNEDKAFKVIFEIHIEYDDGTTEVINSDEDVTYVPSYITASGIYDGEVQDLTKLSEITAENIHNVVPVKEGEAPARLIERFSLPVVEKESIKPVELIVTPKGEYVLDFGQNMAGFVEFDHDLDYGQEIRLDFGEVLQDGNFYNDNYRSAESSFILKSDGIKGRAKPHFTYYGFRYAKVSGLNGPPNPEDFTAKVVYSDLPRTGWLETGDKKVNRLFENTLWGQKSNFVNIPTDCPQRDERLGWTGDAQIFARTASYNMYTLAFYRKLLHELRMAQEDLEGAVPVYVPGWENAADKTSSAWSDVATILPQVIYDFYGDESDLEAYYPLMKDWVDWIVAQDDQRGAKRLWDFGFHFGDWVSLNGRTDQSVLGGTEEAFIASAYWLHSVENLIKAAEVLGRGDDVERYKRLAEEIRGAIFDEFFTPNGRLAIDTQTAYLLALDFGIYKDKKKIIDGLKRRLYMDLYRITGGFIGAPHMLRILSENGLEDEALQFLLNEDFPGWLYEVNLGATTIWERWNSLLPDGTVSGTDMNSLNHYAYGSVVEYLYENIAGLKPNAPGFESVTIKPFITPRLGHCSVSYDSAFGTYEFSWEILEDGHVQITVSVPFGCEALLELPENSGIAPVLLGPGKVALSYRPIEDVRVPFNEHTLFREFADDEGFIETISGIAPQLGEKLKEGDEDILAQSLLTIPFVPGMVDGSEHLDQLREGIRDYFLQSLGQ